MRAMYICMCNAVTDHDIRREVANGVRTFGELQARTGCGNGCGCCHEEAKATLELELELARRQVPCPLPMVAA